MSQPKFRVGDIICLPVGIALVDKQDAYILIQKIKDEVTHYLYDGLDLRNGSIRSFHSNSPMERKAHVAA